MCCTHLKIWQGSLEEVKIKMSERKKLCHFTVKGVAWDKSQCWRCVSCWLTMTTKSGASLIPPVHSAQAHSFLASGKTIDAEHWEHRSLRKTIKHRFTFPFLNISFNISAPKTDPRFLRLFLLLYRKQASFFLNLSTHSW